MNNKSTYTFQKIIDYLKGKLSNRERYDFEKEINTDPFLSDAMDGFSELSSAELNEDLNQISDRIENFEKTAKTVNFSPIVKIAASIALLIGIGSVSYFYIIPKLNPQKLAQQEFTEAPISEPTIPEPMEISENESLIEEKIITNEKKVFETDKKSNKVNAAQKSETISTEDLNEGTVQADFEASDDLSEVIDPVKNKTPDVEQSSKEMAFNKQQSTKPQASPFQMPKMRKKASSATMIMSDEVAFNLIPRDTNQFELENIIITYLSEASIQAVPEIGFEKFENYLRNTKTQRQGAPHRVEVEFVVDAKGRLIAFVIANTDDIYANELIRLLKEGPKWVPAYNDSTAINDTLSISVAF